MADRPFSWAVWVKPAGDGAILSKLDNAQAFRGCDLFLFGDGKVGMHIISDWPENAVKVLTAKPLPRDEWSHVVATYDGSSKAAGVALYVNGEKQDLTAEVDKLNGSFATKQPFRIGKRSADSPLHAAIADVRLFQHAFNAAEAQAVLQAVIAPRACRASSRIRFADALRSQFDKLLLATSNDDYAQEDSRIASRPANRSR